MRTPQIFFILTLSLASLSLSTGCMVLDEIDSANAKMAPKSGASATAATAPGAASPPPTANALLESSKQWWDRATSLAPTEMDASIVNCRIGRNAQFMSKNDCLTRGGVPQGKS